MSRRFYCAEPIRYTPGVPCGVTLQGDEGHHAARVMRVGEGDALTLFDGSGWEFDAEVLSVGRGEVRLSVTGGAEVDREAPVRLTVGVAMPKGDRQKVLVEKLTELGVARLTPLRTERGVAQPKAAAIDKLRRLVVEASKQCGRNRLLQIDEPSDLAEFLAGTEADARLFAHPGTEPLSIEPTCESIAVAIGPEGGFSGAEVEAALAAGWRPWSLGKSVLRIETAAIAAAARLAVRGSN